MLAYEVQQFGIDKLTAVERDVPKCGPSDVLVRMHAASLNFRDVMVASGTYNPRMKMPAVPLSDGAGEVVEVGGEVTRFKVGDRVMPIVVREWIDGDPTAEKSKTAIGAGAIDGVLAEYSAIPESALVAVPQGLSFDEAATLPCAAVTAWNALVVSGSLKAGETVLTLGTGGVSIFAVQFAKQLGARVISTSSSDAKLEKLKDLGADDVINYRTTEDWDKAVVELTGGKGVDHVIEVGGVGTLSRSVKAVKVGGHIASIGALETEGTFNPIPLFMKAIRLHGIFIGSRTMFEDMNCMIASSGIRPVIDRRFGFNEVREAMHYMESGAHFGKIVIGINS